MASNVHNNFDYIGKTTTWPISYSQANNNWRNRQCMEWQLLANNRYSFIEITVETINTLIDIVHKVQGLFHHSWPVQHTISQKQLYFLVLSLISYPSYQMLSALFDISVPSEEIHSCILVFRESYRQHVRWRHLQYFHLL